MARLMAQVADASHAQGRIIGQLEGEIRAMQRQVRLKATAIVGDMMEAKN